MNIDFHNLCIYIYIWWYAPLHDVNDIYPITNEYVQFPASLGEKGLDWL